MIVVIHGLGRANLVYVHSQIVPLSSQPPGTCLSNEHFRTRNPSQRLYLPAVEGCAAKSFLVHCAVVKKACSMRIDLT